MKSVNDFIVGQFVTHKDLGTGAVSSLDFHRGLVFVKFAQSDESLYIDPSRLESYLIQPSTVIAVSSGAADDMLKRHEESKPASLRFNDGKVQSREIDPSFVLGIGEVLTKSREKYPEGNWMKETKFSTPYESCVRHLMKFWSGEDLDNETLKHHLLHAATNLMFLYYHQNSGVGIDDRLFKKEKK